MGRAAPALKKPMAEVCRAQPPGAKLADSFTPIFDLPVVRTYLSRALSAMKDEPEPEPAGHGPAQADSQGRERLKNPDREDDSEVPTIYFSLFPSSRVCSFGLPSRVCCQPILFGTHCTLDSWRKGNCPEKRGSCQTQTVKTTANSCWTGRKEEGLPRTRTIFSTWFALT